MSIEMMLLYLATLMGPLLGLPGAPQPLEAPAALHASGDAERGTARHWDGMPLERLPLR